ncbi:MAG: hypothetical protein ACTHM2_15860 [Afipia sp.]
MADKSMRRDFRRFWKRNNPFSEGMLVPSTITLKNINDLEGVVEGSNLPCEIVPPSAASQFSAFMKATSEARRSVHVISAKASSKRMILGIFAALGRNVPSAAIRAIIITGCRPEIGPFVATAIAAIEVSKECHLGNPVRPKPMKIDGCAVYCAAIKKKPHAFELSLGSAGSEIVRAGRKVVIEKHLVEDVDHLLGMTDFGLESNDVVLNAHDGLTVLLNPTRLLWKKLKKKLMRTKQNLHVCLCLLQAQSMKVQFGLENVGLFDRHIHGDILQILRQSGIGPPALLN